MVELSQVDEGSLERTINQLVSEGWSFDGVQFAMRESSKRPAMAFVTFTREAERLEEVSPPPEAGEGFRAPHEADSHLRRLVGGQEPAPVDPWTRLHQLAGAEEED